MQDRPEAIVSKGQQPASPEIPRTFCNDILTVLASLPEQWPLVKIDIILNKFFCYGQGGPVAFKSYECTTSELATLDQGESNRG